MTEGRSERLGHREHELPVWQVEKHVVREVLCEQERPLLAAGRVQVEPLARESPEVIMTTSRVRTPNPGYPKPVVAAGALFIDSVREDAVQDQQVRDAAVANTMDNFAHVKRHTLPDTLC